MTAQHRAPDTAAPTVLRRLLTAACLAALTAAALLMFATPAAEPTSAEVAGAHRTLDPWPTVAGQGHTRVSPVAPAALTVQVGHRPEPRPFWTVALAGAGAVAVVVALGAVQVGWARLVGYRPRPPRRPRGNSPRRAGRGRGPAVGHWP